MIILGLGGFFHDFNAAAIDTETGRVVAAEEERFSRRKHHSIQKLSETSYDCVRHCLRGIGVGLDRVDVVVLSDEAAFTAEPFLRALFPGKPVERVHHHLSHAAAAFHSSGFTDAAILSLDGFGDGKSGLLAAGHGRTIEPLRFFETNDSIGLEYLRATFQIGLGAFGAEGKTQGLAAYGRPVFFERYMENIRLNPDGTITLSPQLTSMSDFLAGAHYMDTRYLINDFILDCITPRFSDEELEPSHIDFACSIQEVLNTVGVHAARALHRETGCRTLVLAGGVALNSTLNGVIAGEKLFDAVYAHPSASDRGNGLGAALHYLTAVLKLPSPLAGPLVYSGQSFTEGEIEARIAESGLPYLRESDPATAAAQMLADNRIVGWFQGASELGARALGNRSILADPRRADNKDVLNQRVKHREWFRPFAPSALAEQAAEWFEDSDGCGYMTKTVKVREPLRAQVPAVVHEDGTARIQTVTTAQNPLYHRLISAFHARTGVPMVINTSFNDAGDPIVETPEDAIACLRKTDLDGVFIGPFAVFKDAAGLERCR